MSLTFYFILSEGRWKKNSMGVSNCLYFYLKGKKLVKTHSYCWGTTTRNLYSFKKDDCLFFIRQTFFPPLRFISELLEHKKRVVNGLAFHHAQNTLRQQLPHVSLYYLLQGVPNAKRWDKIVTEEGSRYFSHIIYGDGWMQGERDKLKLIENLQNNFPPPSSTLTISHSCVFLYFIEMNSSRSLVDDISCHVRFILLIFHRWILTLYFDQSDTVNVTLGGSSRTFTSRKLLNFSLPCCHCGMKWN